MSSPLKIWPADWHSGSLLLAALDLARQHAADLPDADPLAQEVLTVTDVDRLVEAVRAGMPSYETMTGRDEPEARRARLKT